MHPAVLGDPLATGLLELRFVAVDCPTGVRSHWLDQAARSWHRL